MQENKRIKKARKITDAGIKNKIQLNNKIRDRLNQSCKVMSLRLSINC